jgi:uncharacterized membrane protein
LWANAIAIFVVAVRQYYNALMAKKTHDLVNGQATEQLIVNQKLANKVLTLTPGDAEAQQIATSANDAVARKLTTDAKQK